MRFQLKEKLIIKGLIQTMTFIRKIKISTFLNQHDIQIIIYHLQLDISHYYSLPVKINN